MAAVAFVIGAWPMAPAVDRDVERFRMMLPEGPTPLAEIAREAARRLRCVVAIQESLETDEVRLATWARVDFETLVAVLDAQGVDVHVEAIEGRRVLRAWSHCRLGRVPRADDITVAVHPLRSGRGPEIRDEIRARMIRDDPLRLGSVVHVASGDSLVIADVPRALERHLALVRELDAPGPWLVAALYRPRHCEPIHAAVACRPIAGERARRDLKAAVVIGDAVLFVGTRRGVEWCLRVARALDEPPAAGK